MTTPRTGEGRDSDSAATGSGRRLGLVGFALLSVLFATSAHAVVPGQVNYQGLLLDDQGDPLTGPIDMTFRLYPVDVGGSEIWSETHLAVDVLDGVYEVALGSDVPLSPSLLAGAAVYLEVEVETETLTPRQRLLAVPYALQAEAANSFGGVASPVFAEIYEHFAFDGGDPPNDDPSEGLGDTDGDGIPNFLDADNDDDGTPDQTELALGTDINLVTPRVFSLSPTAARKCVPTGVDVTGNAFDPAVVVDFGSQSPTPQNVTTTSFDIVVGPQSAGNAVVTVSNPNGQQDTDSFTFFEVVPTITDIVPDLAFSAITTPVHVTGTNFDPGVAVAFGSQNPVPTNVTPSGFDVTVGPQPPGVVTVTVTNICGEQAQATDALTFVASAPKRVFVSSGVYTANFGGLTGADALCSSLASGAGLTGTFRAWLSDGVDSPDTRFAKGGDPYTLVDDTVIAVDWNDLTDGTLAAPIDLTQTGGSNPGVVFTNVQSDGTDDGSADCNDWTEGAVGNTRVGSTIKTDAGWTDLGNHSCGDGRLYCFEQ